MAPARLIDVPSSGMEARLHARSNTWDAPTCGVAPGYLQANLIVLPSRYAKDFAILCARNPVPCPLLASSALPGDFSNFKSHIPGIADHLIAKGIDIRTDAPRYNIYQDGELVQTAVTSVQEHWDGQDHVAFLIGCSYSFETALTKAGLIPPHVTHGRNVPMYRTNIPLCPAGVFTNSTFVVSMRMYKTSDVEEVRNVTRLYVATHGEPIAWGWDGMRRIGVQDINNPEWGDAPVTADDREVVQSDEGVEDENVPVFWGCGVSPQEAVMRARIPGTVMGHAPGFMVVLDVKEDDVLR